MERYHDYEFEVWEFWPDAHRMKALGFCYSVYKNKKLVIESKEYFETAQEAHFAAIGHISLLENGEG